jgi:hypothetical protein
MSSDFRSDPEFEAKSDGELLALATAEHGLWDQSRALAVLGRRAAANDEALRTVVEVSKSERGRSSILGIQLSWYGVAGLSAAGTDEARAGAADVMAGWTEEERQTCREYLSLADIDVP